MHRILASTIIIVRARSQPRQYFDHVGRSSSPPHASHPRADVNAHRLGILPPIRSVGSNGPRGAFEKLQQRRGDKAGARSINMPVALVVLPMGEEALRHHKMQIVLGGNLTFDAAVTGLEAAYPRCVANAKKLWSTRRQFVLVCGERASPAIHESMSVVVSEATTF